MTKLYRKIFDEVGDQISTEVRDAIRNIDGNLAKIQSLDAIVEQLEAADEADIFRLVAELPATGKAGEYYIVLNAASNKYEEYTWNGTSYDKIGTIGDELTDPDDQQIPDDPQTPDPEDPQPSDDPQTPDNPGNPDNVEPGE